MSNYVYSENLSSYLRDVFSELSKVLPPKTVVEFKELGIDGSVTVSFSVCIAGEAIGSPVETLPDK